MDHCILVRMDNGRVKAIMSDDYVATWPNLDAAIDASESLEMLKGDMPYQIVCLDEL